MPDGRGWRFAFEVAFLVALAVVLGAGGVSPAIVVVVMLAGWFLVALLEWVAWREEPHWGSGSPPRYYVPPPTLPPRRPVEQGVAGYPSQREHESPTWVATPEMRAAALGEWPVAAPVEDQPVSPVPEPAAAPQPPLVAPEAPPESVRAPAPAPPEPAVEPELAELADIVEEEPLEDALLHEAAAAVGLEDAPVAEPVQPAQNGADPWEVQEAPDEAGRRLSVHRIDPLAESDGRRWPWQRPQDDDAPAAHFPALPRHAGPAPQRREAD